MKYCLYGYMVVGELDKGIVVYEDENNWLRIEDDPEYRAFFHILDIEEELNVKLKLINLNRFFNNEKH